MAAPRLNFLFLSLLFGVARGFSLRPAPTAWRRPVLRPLFSAAAEELDEAAINALWTMTPKSLLSIGGKGVQDSHVRSLQTLLGQHDVVKVKLSDHRTDSGECVAAFDRGLEGYGRLVDVHGSGRYILYESFSSGVDATSFSLFAARQAATKALKEEKARAYREKGEAMAAEAEKASRGGD